MTTDRQSPVSPLAIAMRTAAAILVSGTPAAIAQGTPQQVVRGPVATYWVTASTGASGFGAVAGGGGMGAMMGMLTGRGSGPARSLDLRLGSSQAPGGAPQAAHLIPPGMAMGAQLPLVTPDVPKPVREEQDDLPQGMERPRGRLLLFWGCGEKAGPGQPVVIDFSRIGAGQAVPALRSASVRVPRGPTQSGSRTFGAWPNARDGQPLPPQASLIGQHEVKGNYSPDIRFNIERNDFMAPVELAQSATPSAGRQLTWKPIGGATGYFMSVIGGNEAAGSNEPDIVFWTSSGVQELGASLSDYAPPGEVARLIRERVVLPPDRTECTVPAEVLRAMPMGMLAFVAYGDELNFAHPPRPADPKVPWDIQWTVKVRFKSTELTPFGEGTAGMMGGGARRGGAAASAPPSDATPGAGAARPADGGSPPGAQGPIPGLPGSAGEAVDQGVRVLRGLFGR